MLKSKDDSNDENTNDFQRKLAFPKWTEFKKLLLQLNVINLRKLISIENVKNDLNLKYIIEVMYQPMDAASLGVVRALFGLCMVMDVVEERGFADVDVKWGDPHKCHFPLVHGMEPPSFPWMIVLYTAMWCGAFGIMLGLYFKIACAFFVFPYWYLFVLDKSSWNNHTYLYGIVSILFWSTGANKYFSIDHIKNKDEDETVPFWNYFILKFQFFILYFFAGLKKGCKEWLDGYAMTNLSNHWVFDPFKIFLTTEQTDLFVVHWFGFFFDLTIGFWMIFEKTRFPAMIFCATFHFMNSRLFSIGMFPYVCLATMFLFCDVNWPRKVQRWFVEKIVNSQTSYAHLQKNSSNLLKSSPANKNDLSNNTENNLEKMNNKKQSIMNEQMGYDKPKLENEKLYDTNGTVLRKKDKHKVKKRQIFVVAALTFHIILQMFLPYSHFITKGYNNWVPGLYGYSWDMMVHAWDTILIVIKVHDNERNVDYFIDSDAWVQNERWYKHGDMVKQYAHCLQTNLQREKQKAIMFPGLKRTSKLSNLSSNISIYIDVWCSLNGRFQQRMFNPNIDLLKADWNVFKPVSYLMPLLSDLSYYRKQLIEIQNSVHRWSNYTDVLFVADFPNMFLENYILSDLSNVTLTVLEGSVMYTEEGQNEKRTLSKGFSTSVKTEIFHQIHVISPYPSCYMYTYTNSTKQRLENEGKFNQRIIKDKLPILKEIKYKIKAWFRALSWIIDAFFYFVYNVPIVPRIKILK